MMLSGCCASACSKAVFSAASTPPLISPCRSMMTAPSRCITGWRSLASNVLSGMAVSFQLKDQFDGMLGVSGVDAQVVYHRLNQKQSPPARRLFAGQLGLQVGRWRGHYRRAATLIGDIHN